MATTWEQGANTGDAELNAYYNERGIVPPYDYMAGQTEGQGMYAQPSYAAADAQAAQKAVDDAAAAEKAQKWAALWASEDPSSWDAIWSSGEYMPFSGAAERLAQTLGLGPGQYAALLGEDPNFAAIVRQTTNPHVFNRIAIDYMSNKYNLWQYEGYKPWYDQVQAGLWSAGDQWSDAWHAQNKGASVTDVLKGIAFALLPAAIGPALVGPALAGTALAEGLSVGGGLGGGLGGSVIGAISNPAGALGVEPGLGASVLNTAIKQGVSYGLNAADSPPEQFPTMTVRSSQSRSPSEQENTAPETSSLSQSVMSPQSTAAPSGGGSDASSQSPLSDSVMSVAPTAQAATTQPATQTKRAPIIRLAPGFTRGAG